jgi:uncharacterized protein (TIGR03437 family)
VAPVSGGTAVLSTSALPTGTHVLTAAYSGDASNEASISNTLTYVVDRASPSANIGSSTIQTVFGQAVTFSAYLAAEPPGSGTPTGVVTFWSGAVEIGTGTVNGSGVASLTIATLPVAAHSITIGYPGDSNFYPAAASGFPHTVLQAATTTAVTSTANPSVFGQSVTFTATVSPVAPGAGTPTGTVTFKDGATSLATVALTAATAALSTSSLSVGSHSIVAEYNASPSYTASSGSLTQVVNQGATITAVTASANPSASGAPVTFTANVSAVAPAAGARTGTVSFFDGATLLGTVALSSGQAAFTTSSLSTGSHTVTASYSGDANFTTSTSSSFAHMVGLPPTTTALVSSANPSTYGQSVTFTATVNTASGTPTGTVTFKDGAATIGSGTLNASRQAAFTATALSTGSHSITAVYAGDANFDGSTSAAVAQVTNKAATTTTLTAGGSVSAGASATFSATVTSTAGTPTGAVTFRDGSNIIATVAVSAAGTASASQALYAGAHQLTASYSGDANYAASTSSATPFSVDAVTTSVSAPVLRSGTPAPGELLTFAATVTSERRPTGTILFKDGNTVIGSFPIDTQGTALATARLGIGQHLITATYEGDAENARSISDALLLNVRGTATARLVSSANPSASGAAVTFTATVSGPDSTGPAPTGSVTFTDGAATLGTAQLSSGQASLSVPRLAAGDHAVVAAYAGDSNWSPVSSATLTQRVDRAPSTTALEEGADKNGYFLVATAASQTAGSVPGGSVQFEDLATNSVIGSAVLANGSASLRLASPLPVGHRLRAVYAGDAVFAGSASSSMPFIAATNAFSFAFTFAPEEIVSIFGSDFADGVNSASSATLPETLGGVVVRIVDAGGSSRTAGLYFAGPGQINFVMPAGVAPGPARLAVTTARGALALSLVVGKSSAALASADGSGSGMAAAHLMRVHADGSQDPLMLASSGPAPYGAATDNLYLILYGTGFRYAQGPVACSFNGQSIPALYSGAHSTYAGLDQVNLLVPNALRGAGRVSVNCAIDGETTNTVNINVQ